jgi:hypothetical protein
LPRIYRHVGEVHWKCPHLPRVERDCPRQVLSEAPLTYILEYRQLCVPRDTFLQFVSMANAMWAVRTMEGLTPKCHVVFRRVVRLCIMGICHKHYRSTYQRWCSLAVTRFALSSDPRDYFEVWDAANSRTLLFKTDDVPFRIYNLKHFRESFLKTITMLHQNDESLETECSGSITNRAPKMMYKLWGNCVRYRW